MTAENFIDRLVDPNVRIGTSTPEKDPSGDYAWAIFRCIDQVRPGAFAVLDAKAQKLVGGSEPTAASTGYGLVGDALTSGRVDVFLGYRTGMARLAAELDGVDLIDIPSSVDVTPEYGMAALNGCRPEAMSFALFILSASGQALLAQHGFQPVALPQNR
jgi:molybdate transport system substrate-binding protein